MNLASLDNIGSQGSRDQMSSKCTSNVFNELHANEVSSWLTFCSHQLFGRSLYFFMAYFMYILRQICATKICQNKCWKLSKYLGSHNYPGLKRELIYHCVPREHVLFIPWYDATAHAEDWFGTCSVFIPWYDATAHAARLVHTCLISAYYVS